ncbi:DUF1376 domain-containing protein [Mesorhizobium sp. GR13]|uniref:DUF1376 domain-containing protein n=1 Tax=Mesorhizobium sp. GR13 TaxID=2562308 RepID=UPI0010C1474B|nr:DUF1376 domain-containing protein [Mesorhizobium sp. GR13]
MTDLAWMRTYIGDEAAVTGHLTAEEFGAYERLRRHYWQHGSLPSDAPRMMRITAVDIDRWSSVWEAIGPLLDHFDRLDLEREDAAAKRERKVMAGRKGAQKRWGDGPANGNTNGITNSNANSSAISTPNGSAIEQNGKSNGSANGITNGYPIATSTSTRSPAYEDKVLPDTHARAKEPVPAFSSMREFREWLGEQVFPGCEAFEPLVRKWMDGTITMDDVRRAAA